MSNRLCSNHEASSYTIRSLPRKRNKYKSIPPLSSHTIIYYIYTDAHFMIATRIMANTYPVTHMAPFTAENSSRGSTLSPETSLGVPDFFGFSDWIQEIDPPLFSFGEESDSLQINPVLTSKDTVVNSTGISISSNLLDDHGTINGEFESWKEKKENRHKVAFKTKSQIEILDDGFKWRKYGKKMVKNSPNPRNYFKCSVEGCRVKKRVERDKDDPHYVVTTYEGIHNHQGPYL